MGPGKTGRRRKRLVLGEQLELAASKGSVLPTKLCQVRKMLWTLCWELGWWEPLKTIRLRKLCLMGVRGLG